MRLFVQKGFRNFPLAVFGGEDYCAIGVFGLVETQRDVGFKFFAQILESSLKFS